MRRALLLLLCAGIAGSAQAANPNWKACTKKSNDTERLACYDKLTSQHYSERSALTRAWDLDGRGNPDAEGVRRLDPYRSNLVLVQHTSRINNQPSSTAPLHSTTAPYPYLSNEVKFQFSAKSEIGNFRELELLGFRDLRI